DYYCQSYDSSLSAYIF
nr:immunoglobulin light chain junction region [Macaca mulatta]MOV95648.1 immunoglobulin light chain junction region [Macaca mulatta]MOV96040.1 immunoglobulin light chain junction region [Macaca mulatta]MOV96851.1 immunoglobulin light chain junction region [Macaca mulatta]MOV97140.1 immunoglobulin light chain junction region [Macaca mulatta]